MASSGREGSQVVGWLFRDRATGEIVVFQAPNPSLIVFLVATLVRTLADPVGRPRTLLDGVASFALAWWAIDEILRGVNPFRRILGAVVLTYPVLRLLLR